MQPVYESNGFVERFTLGEGSLSFAVKDTLNVAGYRTQAGCPALAQTPAAAQHASVVETLLASGCRLAGKTTLHELAFGVTGINAWGGTPVNPLYPTLIPGGSSSGSAGGVAAGEVDVSLGTATRGAGRPAAPPAQSSCPSASLAGQGKRWFSRTKPSIAACPCRSNSEGACCCAASRVNGNKRHSSSPTTPTMASVTDNSTSEKPLWCRLIVCHLFGPPVARWPSPHSRPGRANYPCRGWPYSGTPARCIC